ncbi:pyridine nucleotide-disulfide oxidoreductase, partial [Arthrobacter cryoconiti]|nr:pyridine nucleotide-disulfide oxidoreductase [Arthrobacter cryoconiti]
VLYEEDFDFDEASDVAVKTNNQIKTMVNTLSNWLVEQEEDAANPSTGASRRLHLHFLHNPVEIMGVDGQVTGIKFERNELDGTGNARGTGEFIDYPVQAVYRSVGYFGSAVADVDFDHRRGVVSNDAGRILGVDGAHVPGLYATGWIKRGPVGLIGSTKGDALETITHLLADRANLPAAVVLERDAILDLLDSRDVEFTTWEGWHELDAHEKSLGIEASGMGPVQRERVKVVSREEMVHVSRGAAVVR